MKMCLVELTVAPYHQNRWEKEKKNQHATKLFFDFLFLFLEVQENKYGINL